MQDFVSVCTQVQHGVQALFGPSDSLLGAHIGSICNALDVPLLEARMDLEPEYKDFSINLYPSHTVLNQAFQDVMSYLNWSKIAIIYEDDISKIQMIYHF